MPWHEPFRQLQLHEQRIAQELRSFKHRVIVALIIIAVGCTWGIFQSNRTAGKTQSLLVQFKAETKARREETCRTQVQQYNEKVDNYNKTLTYLAKLPPQERKLTLNQFIIASLPKTKNELKVKPSKFCKIKIHRVH